MDKLAQNLKIQLFRNEEKKVDLTFKAKTLEWITELIPSYLAEKIQAKGIDLNNLQKKAKEKLTPQSLLLYEDNEIRIHIWLE